MLVQSIVEAHDQWWAGRDWHVAEEHIVAARSDHSRENRARDAVPADTKEPDRTCRKASLVRSRVSADFRPVLSKPMSGGDQKEATI